MAVVNEYKFYGKTTTSAESVERGILIVRTTTPAWRQELLFQKKEIIKAINKELKNNIVKDIRFI